MISYKNKEDFLEQLSNIGGYVEYLGELIAGGRFNHSYGIEFRKWKKENGPEWNCSSLLQAKENYWWHGSFEVNQKKLNVLSDGIINSSSECDALYWSMRILEWGDVYKGCTGYILNKFEKKSLCQDIKSAVDLLESDNYDLKRFDQNDLRMDSGLTKIYSLASKKSIILDSRVVASLSLIACRFFNEDSLDKLKKLSAFACGTSNSSEKKRSQIRGVKIFSPYLKPENQAHYNLVTNWILEAAIIVAKQKNNQLLGYWSVKNDTGLLRSVESALFMVGSDISRG